MRQRPIVFDAEEVRAVLADRKMQMRRVVRSQPKGVGWSYRPCPYGVPGDRLWVRETWALLCGNPWPDLPSRENLATPPLNAERAYYKASFDRTAPRWRSPIHMPRWASRLTLEVLGVRVERLHEISEADAMAEGASLSGRQLLNDGKDHLRAFRDAWDRLDAKRVASARRREGAEALSFPWAANPWVWVIQFRVVQGGGSDV
jgi:hypothetical protein